MSLFEHAIVGIDGREGGRDAVALAQALVAHRITLVCAYAYNPDHGFHPMIQRQSLRHVEEIMRDDAQRTLEAARLAEQVEAELVAVPDPSPARALHRTARAAGADLIVVGSSHHGRSGRVRLGDVGRAVVHDSPCAVAVAPHGFREHVAAPQTVVAGFDGTPEAQAALRHAAAIAAARHADLRVGVVAPRPPQLAAAVAYAGEIEAIEAEDLERARRVLAEALAGLPEDAQGELRQGRPATELAALAGPADLLVVGSRGWGTLRRVVLGSTADRLVHDAPCPVLVVPRPGTDADDQRPRSAAGHDVSEVVA